MIILFLFYLVRTESKKIQIKEIVNHIYIENIDEILSCSYDIIDQNLQETNPIVLENILYSNLKNESTRHT